MSLLIDSRPGIRAARPTKPETAAPAAAHMSGMTPSAIADPRITAPISLAPGTGDNFAWLAENAAIERLDVHRYQDGYVVCPSQTIDFTTLFGAGLSSDEFLDRHERLIGDFMTEHYGAQMEGDDWDSQELEFVTPLTETDPTGADVLNAALTGTSVLRLREDSAGSDLAALLMERISNSVVVENRNRSMAIALRMDASAVDTETTLRCGRREISDATAMAIARSFSTPELPNLTRLSRSGYALKEPMWDELRRLYEEHRSNARLALRIDMMFTWVLHGGEND